MRVDPSSPLTGAYPPGVFSAWARQTSPCYRRAASRSIPLWGRKRKAPEWLRHPEALLSLKPPEGIQAYTVQMPQPSKDRIARNQPKVKPEKYQNVGSCQLLRQVKVCQFSPHGAPCAPILLRSPRPALAAVAAALVPQPPGTARRAPRLWRPPQRTPGGEDTRKSSRQAPRAQLYKIQNDFCMYSGLHTKV